MAVLIQADLCLMHSPLAQLPLAALVMLSESFSSYIKELLHRTGGDFLLTGVQLLFLHKDVYKCVWRQQRSTSNRRVWQSRCRLPSLAGKQGSLWKMLSVHCGFTATMSTSTILVHLAAWASRSSEKINMNIVLTFKDYNNLSCVL